MRCCHKEENVFKEEDYDYYDDVEEEVTQKAEGVEEIEGDGIKSAEDAVETTEKNPGNISEEVNEIIEENENNGDGIVVTTEHGGDVDDDNNEIPVLTEEDSGENKENVTESSDQDEDDKSEEGEQLFNPSDYDYYDKDEDASKESQEIEGTNDTSNATESAEHDLNQGQVVVSGTEKQNEDMIVESTTNMEEGAVTEIPDDTTGGYKVVIMLEQGEKVEEDAILDEEIYEEHHDNEEASKESSGILDNNTVWKEEITEAISTEDELKPEETTFVENEEVFSSTAAPTIIEDGNENIEFVPIETKELETNQEIGKPEEESEKINTEKISLTIKPKTKTTRKPKYHEYQTKMTGSSTIFKPIMGQIMGILYVIKYLLIF